MDAHAAPGGDPELAAFARIFFDEAQEHLEGLESLLVALEPACASDDELNAIFRAAHSIKGGAGTFGFKDMAAVTHELESLLERARRRTLVLTPPMIDALLAARDVLGAQLARHRGEDASPPDAEATCRTIRAFLAGAPEAMAPEKAPRPVLAPVKRRFEVSYPVPDSADARLAILAAFDELGADAGGEIETTMTADELRDALGFVIDPEGLVVSEVGNSGTDPSRQDSGPVPAVPSAIDGFGLFEPVAVPAAAAVAAAPVAGTARSETRATANAENLSIRVGVDKVDLLINLVGELVITQAMLAQKAAAMPKKDASFSAGMGELERNTRDLQEAVMSIRMLPIAVVFNRFPRMLRELAARLGKELELKLVGETTELDRGVIEKLSDPMTHLVRNAVDHGIEAAAERVAAGKPAHGTLTLSARHQGGHIVIEVADDGRGLDRAKLVAKARERGLAIADDATDTQVWNLIFEPGFSTAKEVTDVSGRGVGMDVVRRNILALGGRVDIDSLRGQGTRITVRLPLTLAIMDGMDVGVGADRYIVPLNTIVELIRPKAADLKGMAGRGRVVKVREEYLPVIDLGAFLGGAPDAHEVPTVLVVVEADGAKVAVPVDQLHGQHQVVVKNLESHYRKVPGVSGATILGDGKVALIVDTAAIVRGAAQIR